MNSTEIEALPVSINISRACTESKVLRYINTLRGFPDGFDLEEYPRQTDVERASPGITKAQRKAMGAIGSHLSGMVRFDTDGNPTFTIFVPKGWNIKLEKSR